MITILWVVLAILIINLALVVVLVISPGRPEWNTLRWAMRKRFVTEPEVDLRIMEAIAANEKRKAQEFVAAIRRTFGGAR